MAEYSEPEPTPDVPAFRDAADAAAAEQPLVHVYGKDERTDSNIVCDTETAGYPTPDNRSPLELVVDATEGFIPLWANDVTLRWRFRERSMTVFRDPPAAKTYLRQLVTDALLLWGAWRPVRFTEARDAWDFEVVVDAQKNCSPNGCVLASAFFPDAGQHALTIYPSMFEQPHGEQVETLAHEIGHTFGLRHFFAQITETTWRSELFGNQNPFSIMNYGANSKMTQADRDDLKRLYQLAWSGSLTQINGTPIRLVRPFSAMRFGPVAIAAAPSPAVALAE